MLPRSRLVLLALALPAAVLIYWSYEGIGFDPAFPRGGSLGDFGSLYEMGRAAATGMDLYGIYPLTYFGVPNINVPLVALVFMPLSLLEPVAAARVWNIGAALAYMVTVGLLLRAYPTVQAPWRLLWALALSSLWGTLALGQIYTYLSLVATAAWLLLRRDRPVRAGLVMAVVVALKPNFLVWPLLLALAGVRRAALVALAGAGVLWLVAAAVLGPGVYQRWLTVLRDQPQPVASPTNGSLVGVAARLGAADLVGLLAAAALLGGLGWWAWRCRPDIEQASGAGITAALLAFPLSWTGYSVFLLPVFLSRRWRLAMACAAGVLVVPIRVLIASAGASTLSNVVVGSAYCVAWLLVLIEVLQVPASVDTIERQLESET